MADTAAKCRDIEHLRHRASRIGHQHPSIVPPLPTQPPLEPLWPHVVNEERVGGQLLLDPPDPLGLPDQAGRAMILVIAPEPAPAEMLAELEALRAENARLRDLLGLDGRAAEMQGAGRRGNRRKKTASTR